MPVTLSVKNVPDQLAARLRERAERNHRSLQGELIAILEEAEGSRPITVRELREMNQALGFHTESDSTQIVREMRDARYGL